MRVHGVGAGQEIVEMGCAHGTHQRQADGRPHRIAPAHPVEHGKHIFRGNAEFGGGGHLARHGHKMAADIGFSKALLQKPSAGGAGVEQGFGGGKRFAGHDKHGAGGVELLQRLRQIGAVNIGHKMNVHALAVGLECQGSHLRPQVGAADADVDHIGDGVATRAQVAAVVDGFGKRQCARAFAPDIGHHIVAVHIHAGTFRQP